MFRVFLCPFMSGKFPFFFIFSLVGTLSDLPPGVSVSEILLIEFLRVY